MNDELLSLVEALDGIRQSPRYHPEGDALFHSLQVFELACRSTPDRVLWAAALFHDVGKAIDTATHDEIGADLLEGLLCERAVWLVRHHLDLLRDPRATRYRYRGTAALRDLEKLRRWDLGGRDPRARVMSVEGALHHLFQDGATDLQASDADGSFDPGEP
jgi:HD superfamily phosphodiesterase